jgi:transcription antitermination factor NusG
LPGRGFSSPPTGTEFAHNPGPVPSLFRHAVRSEFPDVPILPKQRDIYPLGLFDESEPTRLVLPDCHWVAFYTLARREKDLMRRLEALGVPFFAPLIRRRLHSAGGRVRTSYVPLFPGYVFSLVDDEQRRAALGTNTISRWLSVPDERMLEHDLRGIKRLIDVDKPLTPEARLEPGQLVRVRSGPLRGTEGTVVGRKGSQRLVVAVRFLNQGASIELEDVDLERL